ncbi:hypothetical protein EGJ29_16775, partial [Pseudomonas sp. s199]
MRAVKRIHSRCFDDTGRCEWERTISRRRSTRSTRTGAWTAAGRTAAAGASTAIGAPIMAGAATPNHRRPDRATVVLPL